MEGFGRTFHLGKMALSYKSVLSEDRKKLIVTYTVDDRGFVDPNYLDLFSGDDNEGPNKELGGTPYDYEPVIWTEVYDNPGYTADEQGKVLPLNKGEKK